MALGVLGGGALAACSGGDGGVAGNPSSQASSGGGGVGAGTGAGGDVISGGGGDDTLSGSGGSTAGLDVSPSAAQTITVKLGSHQPTVDFAALLNDKPANVAWSVDVGAIGAVAPALGPSTTFTPSGSVAGSVKVRATLNEESIERTIVVKLSGTQNGADPDNPAQAPQIAGDPTTLNQGGGVGGVGGEGLGQPVTDAGTLAALTAPGGDGKAQGLKMLYPYDNTVWPRGMLAPLLMWDWSLGDADAVRIELSTTSGLFSWTGTFARPAVLGPTGKFVRHPIPQDVWAAATNTAGAGDKVTVRVTVAKDAAGYGPLTQTWSIAPARLSGVIYYNSYNSRLATGAAGVLSIRAGETAPKAIGGTESCLVCHSVAADGSRLISQKSDYDTSVVADLTPDAVSDLRTLPVVKSWFPGLTGDGSRALYGNKELVDLTAATSTVLPTTGLEAYTSTNMPNFSGDSAKVAFVPNGTNSSRGPTLVVMDFNEAASAFTNPTVVVDDSAQPNNGKRPGWPAFMPDGKSLVFHHQISATSISDGDGHYMWTRRDARARIDWASTSGAADVTSLDRLNGLEAGVSYLPTLAQATVPGLSCDADGHEVAGIDPTHASDTDYNYEPTVNPIASGGYAWVVFTSRRMYGSVATTPPFCSVGAGVLTHPTTKKLWVAAIDLDAAPGADSSHPAFYLPAQELMGVNSRGFWVQDPCKSQGESCESGDQCCGGFCRPDASGALECLDTPPDNTCSLLGEACTSGADCCDSTQSCVGGYCAVRGPA